MREKVHDLDLAPHSISYHQDYVNSDAAFELTKGRNPDDTRARDRSLRLLRPARRTDDPSEWEEMIVRTRSLADIAERYGVILAEEFEPKFVVGSTADLLRLFEEVGSPALAANLDLGHLFLCDPDPIASIHAVGDRIAHCHIENMARGVHDHLLPQEGDMDLLQYVQALADVGYAGPLSLDLYKYDYEAIAPDAIAYVRGLLDQVKRS